jgi:flagellar motor switch protein FliM
MLPVYKTIAVEVLATVNDIEMQILKEMLQKLCDNLSGQIEKNNPIFVEFDKYRMITHLILMKSEAGRQNLTKI